MLRSTVGIWGHMDPTYRAGRGAIRMRHILILDDDEAISELLEIVLTEEGYEVQRATTVGQALEIVHVCRPSLVLFDLRLAHEDGAAFVRSYRKLPGSTGGLIAFSGMPNLEEEAVRLGADGYLSKPFDLDDLLTLADRHLRRS
jgi:two-component system, OmpR family, response regulator MtrA